jgi:hypothetical protein
MVNSTTHPPTITRALKYPAKILIHPNLFLFALIISILSIPALCNCSTYSIPILIEKTTQNIQETNIQIPEPSKDFKWSKIYLQDAPEAPARTLIEFKKINENGQVAWTRIVGYDQDSWITDALQLSDKSYIAVGSTGSRYGSSFLIIKLSDDGSITWFKTIGEGLYSIATKVTENEKGNLIVSGNIQGYECQLTKVTLEFDPNGLLISKIIN